MCADGSRYPTGEPVSRASLASMLQSYVLDAWLSAPRLATVVIHPKGFSSILPRRTLTPQVFQLVVRSSMTLPLSVSAPWRVTPRERTVDDEGMPLLHDDGDRQSRAWPLYAHAMRARRASRSVQVQLFRYTSTRSYCMSHAPVMSAIMRLHSGSCT